MKRRHPEAALQKACVNLLEIYERQGKLLFFAVPNGGKRNVREAANLKKQGTRPGVPDICIITFGKATFLELKAPEGRLSKHQERWREELTNKGIGWALIRSVDDLTKTLSIILHGNLMKGAA